MERNKKDDVITHINGKAATEMRHEEDQSLGKEGTEVIPYSGDSGGKQFNTMLRL